MNALVSKETPSLTQAGNTRRLATVCLLSCVVNMILLNPTAIELNLRLPSMLHGKKGFERIVWAFKNVLNRSVTWLFYDCKSPRAASEQSPDMKNPIEAYHPLHFSITQTISCVKGVKVPPLTTVASEPQDNDWALETQEWIDLVALQSPSIKPDERLDPYLCRYTVPDAENAVQCDLMVLEWRGFIPSEWIRNMMVHLWYVILCAFYPRKTNRHIGRGKVVQASIEQDADASFSKMHQLFASPQAWFSLSAYAFPTQPVGNQEAWKLLRLAHDEGDDVITGSYVLWEMYT